MCVSLCRRVGWGVCESYESFPNRKGTGSIVCSSDSHYYGQNGEKRLRNAKLHKNWIKNQWQRFNGVVNPNFKLLAQVIIKGEEKGLAMSVYRHQ